VGFLDPRNKKHCSNTITTMYQITNIYALAAFGTIGGALFGFDVSSMSAWIDREQYLEYFNHPNSNMQGGVRGCIAQHPIPSHPIPAPTPTNDRHRKLIFLSSQITASMSAGSFIGALCAGFIADKWGRRYALMGAAIVWIIGAAIQCSAQNVGHLIAGRIVSGLSVGVTSSQVCVYLAELAPGRIRGRIVGLQQWSIEWGILIMFLVAYGCTSVAGPAAFRIAWGVQAIPGFVLFGALIFFPESPRWLAGQERWEECLGVLAAIHAKGNRDDPLVQAEYMEVQEAVRVMQEAKGVGFLELFGPKVWKVSGRYAPV
jgi:MFS family permease